jgi:very-short-patch-repair endonuclease
MLRYNPNLKPLARSLRSAMTGSEQALWSRVRRKQVFGVQFYRQKPIGKHIVDFYAPRAKLVVEVDGSQHLEAEQFRGDEERDAYLAGQGLLVMRLTCRC